MVDFELMRAEKMHASGVPAEGVIVESGPVSIRFSRFQSGAPRGADGCPGASMGVKVELGAAPARGPADAPVTIVVFADFEEPFSQRVQATLKALDQRYPGKLRFISKQNPLSFDEHAASAARAAFAAAEQGKFWELHDRLFLHQDHLEPADILADAKQLGLDLRKVQQRVERPRDRGSPRR